MDLTGRIRTLIEAELEDSEFFIVDVIGGDKSKKISVLLDGDEGITIQKCAQVSRAVSKIIDEDEFESEAFILEVGSPGAANPLVLPRQYTKHVSRTLLVELKDGSRIKGKLSEANAEEIQLEPTGKKKKKKSVKAGQEIEINALRDVEETEVIPFSEIHQSTVVISFK